MEIGVTCLHLHFWKWDLFQNLQSVLQSRAGRSVVLGIILRASGTGRLSGTNTESWIQWLLSYLVKIPDVLKFVFFWLNHVQIWACLLEHLGTQTWEHGYANPAAAQPVQSSWMSHRRRAVQRLQKEVHVHTEKCSLLLYSCHLETEKSNATGMC